LQAQFSQARLQESLDPQGHPFSGQPHIPVLLDAARQHLSTAGSREQKVRIADRIRQLEAFQREMQNFTTRCRWKVAPPASSIRMVAGLGVGEGHGTVEAG